MSNRPNSSGGNARGFLMSLARDVRGNTLILLTAMLIPMVGMVGGGIDISRMYILKTRLQHACDAGALAGRKTMGAGVWSYNSNYARTQAEKFFDANFEAGSFGSSKLSRVFTENAGKVTGTVSAEIPMTLMKVFGKMKDTIPVTCDAEMRLPNTDVMFVLDTTGSMGETPSGDSMTKLESLKLSVKCFYEIVARLDTDANCTTGVPSGGTGNQVQIRFGFVPYSTNVNVGKLLPTSYFPDSWEYQTRKAKFNDDPNNFTWVQRSQRTIRTERLTQTNVPQNSCNNQSAAAAGYNSSVDSYSNGNRVKTTVSKIVNITGWTSASGGTCSGDRPEVETIYDKVQDQAFVGWRYAQLPVNISLLKDGTTWRNSFQWPVGSQGTDRTIRWDGCIEERQTVKLTDYDPIPAGAKDLNIDLVPTGDITTQWKPVLNDIVFTRNGTRTGIGDTTGWNRTSMADGTSTTAEYTNTAGYFCPTEAERLKQWPVASEFDDYVDSLVASGNTYHDIGLIWGARLSSPTGIFGADNDFTAQGGDIERNIIFMTDGDACTGVDNYTAYGIAFFDRRQTSDSAVPTAGCTSNSATLTEQVNRRTEALCAAIKNHTWAGRQTFTLWVIAFGNLATSTEDRLEDCATPGRYFKATNAASLQSTFKQIADQISMLRLTN